MYPDWQNGEILAGLQENGHLELIQMANVLLINEYLKLLFQ